MSELLEGTDGQYGENSSMITPIFIFSAGWRSGSTMLQRVITSTGQVLIWGESGGALNRLAEMLACYQQMLAPGNQRFTHGFGGNGAEEFREFKAGDRQGGNKWIACMNPPLDLFNTAARSFFEAVYARPAAALGYSNWGVKEVRSGIDTAKVLNTLYPKARFIFLVRNPVSCMTSIKRHDWMDRPDDRHALDFYAEHWLRLAQEFRRADFGMCVKYEDLISSDEWQAKLGSHLGLVSLSQLMAKAKRVDWASANEDELSYLERRRLISIVGKEMKEYGYH